MPTPADSNLVMDIPEEFLRQFEKEILGRIPDEKAQAELRQQEIGKYLVEQGSACIEGIGQRIGAVDIKTYYRWIGEYGPECWQDKGFIRDFFMDNKGLKDKGWNPKPNSVRHGITFCNGKPISNLKGI